jgi:hypothetical protein
MHPIGTISYTLAESAATPGLQRRMRNEFYFRGGEPLRQFAKLQKAIRFHVPTGDGPLAVALLQIDVVRAGGQGT